VAPPGEAREDWDIIAELYSRLTGEPHARKVSDVTEEIKKEVPFYTGSCCKADGRCSGLVKQLDATPASFAFNGLSAIQAGNAADSQFPFTLSVGAIGFHNGTMSTRSDNNLSVSANGYIEIFEDDAKRLGIAEGSTIRLTSASASTTGAAKVSAALQQGVLFAPYHFSELKAAGLLSRKGNLVNVKIEKG
jgi:formate dehydrogenase alpha subunit